MDAFYLDQNISRPGLEAVPIGTPRVLIGTLKCRAQFPTFVRSGLFFRDFLSQELHLDVFLIRSLKLSPFILIIRSLKTIII